MYPLAWSCARHKNHHRAAIFWSIWFLALWGYCLIFHWIIWFIGFRNRFSVAVHTTRVSPFYFISNKMGMSHLERHREVIDGVRWGRPVTSLADFSENFKPEKKVCSSSMSPDKETIPTPCPHANSYPSKDLRPRLFVCPHVASNGSNVPT